MKWILVNIVNGFILNWNEKQLLSVKIMAPLHIKLTGMKLSLGKMSSSLKISSKEKIWFLTFYSVFMFFSSLMVHLWFMKINLWLAWKRLFYTVCIYLFFKYTNLMILKTGELYHSTTFYICSILCINIYMKISSHGINNSWDC